MRATETAFGDLVLTTTEEVSMETLSRYVTSVCDNPTDAILDALAMDLRLAIRAARSQSKQMLMWVVAEAQGYRGDEQAEAALHVQEIRQQSPSDFTCSAF